jgi:hypothetical protein
MATTPTRTVEKACESTQEFSKLPVPRTLPFDVLKTRKILIGTPMYSGMCQDAYTQSLSELMILASKYGVDIRFTFTRNESLITRARNYIADLFMRSDCTHLMFIDSDIAFDPMDVLALAVISDEAHEIVCGPYPKKNILWRNVKAAVEKGLADKDPSELKNYGAEYVYTAAKQGLIDLNEPTEVLEAGTGFMMIRRSALDKIKEHFPELMYRPDSRELSEFSGENEIMMFFQALIDNKLSNIVTEMDSFLRDNPGVSRDKIMAFVKDNTTSSCGTKYSRRYLSEDYMFCRWARKIGIKTWLCPWIELGHTGTYTFAGSLSHLVQVGVAKKSALDT